MKQTLVIFPSQITSILDANLRKGQGYYYAVSSQNDLCDSETISLCSHIFYCTAQLLLLLAPRCFYTSIEACRCNNAQFRKFQWKFQH